MKKRIKIFVMCFVLLCMSVFTGCSLVETDNYKMYNQVVTEIFRDGKKVAEITNRELLSGYNSYGSSYVQYYGYSVSKAVDMTLKQLENRKITILLEEEKEHINYESGENLSEIEKSYLYETTYDSLISNLDSYYDDIVVKESDEESSSDDLKFNGYEKKVTLRYSYDEEQGVYVPYIEKNESEGLLDDYRPKEGVYKSYYNATDKGELYHNFIDKVLKSNDKNYQRALNYYLADLQAAELGMKYSKNDTSAIFEREIERLYRVNYENYLIQKYSESNKNDQLVSSVSVDDILRLYSSKVRASYTKYVIEKGTTYDSDISSSINNVYYFKNDNDDKDATKYFKVANILFKFNDEQTEQYNKIKNNYDNAEFPDEEAYKSDLEALYAQIKPVIRQLNKESNIYEETDEVDTVDNLINKIKASLKATQNTNSDSVIGDKINDFIYTYNEDSGMFNSEANYVIGVDKDGKAVSSFVDEFNEAGLSLYNDGNGKVGDVAVAYSSYGVHVLVYTGKCENLFDGINETFELGGNNDYKNGSNVIEKLYNTRVNILLDKSYFDLLYDEIFEDNFSNFEQANINSIIDRDKYSFKVYKGRFESSLKG